MKKINNYPNGSFMKVWFFPTLIAILSLTGLVAALLADAWIDLVSCCLLAVPIYLALKFTLFPKSR
ncbi:hypothetical protein LAG90_18220 [Marinilongibacter aquaticus]|uniref:hypothetical protein n=1 Tax=Marinilongibacter aquaticus TaxID=2975157 RepID=UPI0021BD6110|nr:hypothetical protein [Marinilongibacter aquaticus]UBM58739.1 hypothetical protein LAG90_18220 [Marinilongibacter aquaticus]